MKKIMNIFVLVAAAAMALVSCQRQEIPETETNTSKSQEYLYRFDISANAKSAIGDNCVVWEEDDKIGVYASTSVNQSGNVTVDPSVSFTVKSTVALTAGDKVYCYYPYASHTDDATAVSMTIPTEQTEQDQMPMVSLPFAIPANLEVDTEKSVGEISFANLGSIIEFNVYSTTPEYQTEKIQSVTFNAVNAIAGDFAFDITSVDYSKKETLKISGYAAKSVVSTLATPVVVPSKVDAAKVVKMVVAPCENNGKVVVTTDKAKYTYTLPTYEFVRSGVKTYSLNLREDVREAIVASTATLSSDEIKTTIAASKCAYGAEVVYDDALDGVVWKSTCLTDAAGRPWLQMRSDKTVYIAIESDGNIEEVVVTVTGASNSAGGVLDISAHTAFAGTLSLNTASDGSGTVVASGEASDKIITLVPTSVNKVLYLKTSSGARVWNIEVKKSGTVNTEPEVVTLSSIKVSDTAKTEYIVGDAFDEPTVVATYSDNTTKEVEADFSGYNMDAAGTYIVNVSYTENEVTVTDSYEIVVKAKEDAEIVAHIVTWDLAKDETSEASDSKLAWDADGVSMVNSKGTAQSGANNYYPGTAGKSYTSTRFYNGNNLNITPKEGYAIKSVVFTATTEGYANALKNSTWSNAFAIVSGTTVTINPEDGREEILASITGTCGFTKVVVDLVPSEGYVKPVVVLSSIALNGQTTNYTVGDTFSFTGTVTATYSNGATKTVTPTQVSTPDMTTAGDKEVIVTYTEEGVTATAKYTITVSVAAATKKYYEKVTTAPSDWSGTYLIVAGTSAANGTITSKWLKYNSVSITNNQIESTSAVDAIAVTIKKESDGNYSIRFANGNYLGTTTSNDGIKVATSVSTGFYWKFSVASSLVKIESTVQSSRILRLNGTSGFRTYTTSTGNQATLYKLQN